METLALLPWHVSPRAAARRIIILVGSGMVPSDSAATGGPCGGLPARRGETLRLEIREAILWVQSA